MLAMAGQTSGPNKAEICKRKPMGSGYLVGNIG